MIIREAGRIVGLVSLYPERNAMKTIAIILLTAGLNLPAAQCKELRLWLKLTGNRVMLDAVLVAVSGDTAVLNLEGRPRRLALREIEQLRLIREKSILEGALVGVGAGIVAGSIIGFLGRSMDDRPWNVKSASLTLGMMGGLVGTVVSSVPDAGDIIDVSSLSVEQRGEVLKRFLDEHEALDAVVPEK